MSPSDKAALVGVAVYFTMHLIDAFIPHGRHFKFVDKWFSEGDETSPS
jgi:hypothetical protein